MNCSASTQQPGAAVAGPADLLAWADALTHAITALEMDDEIARACPATWAWASTCLQSTEPADQLIGYRLLLVALTSTPGAAQELIERLARALAGQR